MIDGHGAVTDDHTGEGNGSCADRGDHISDGGRDVRAPVAGPASHGCEGPYHQRCRWHREAMTSVVERCWCERMAHKDEDDEDSQHSAPHRCAATVSSRPDRSKLVVRRVQDVEDCPPKVRGTERLDEVSLDAGVIGPITIRSV